jgi:hypothetical protein
MRLPSYEHIITSAVAAAVVALALAEGGFAPTAYAAAGLIAWATVVVGLATGVVPRSEPPAAAIAAGACLAGFAGLIALSLVWASDDGRAFEDLIRALAYLGAFVLVIVASRRGGGRAWLYGLAIGLAAVAAIAMLARFEPSLFGDPDAELRETLPAAAGRLTYPIGYWNGLAAALAAAAPLLVWAGASALGRVARAAAIAMLPLLGLALWATDSRGGVVAAAAALAVLVIAGRDRSRQLAGLAIGGAGAAGLIAIATTRDELFDLPGTAAATSQGDAMLAITIGVVALTGVARYLADRRVGELAIAPRAGRIAAVAVAVAAVALVALANPIERWEEFKEPPTGAEITGGDQADLLRTGGSGRYQFWEAAVDAFAEAPASGIGAGEYGPYWLENREVPLTATRAHSLAFETLAELGLVGLALIAGFFAVAAVAGVIRLRRAERVAELAPALAVLSVGIAAVAVDWTWDLPGALLPAIVAAALLAGPATLPGPPEGRRVAFGTAGSRRRFAGGVIVLLVAWVAICGSGLLLLSDHSLDSSREAFARGDLDAAIDSADAAADLEPWASGPRTQLALLYESAGDLPAARKAIDDAIERAPESYQLYVLRSRIAAAAGDTAESRASLERAAELNPLDEDLGGEAPS